MDRNAIIERCKKMIWDVSSALMSVVYIVIDALQVAENAERMKESEL